MIWLKKLIPEKAADDDAGPEVAAYIQLKMDLAAYNCTLVAFSEVGSVRCTELQIALGRWAVGASAAAGLGLGGAVAVGRARRQPPEGAANSSPGGVQNGEAEGMDVDGCHAGSGVTRQGLPGVAS